MANTIRIITQFLTDMSKIGKYREKTVEKRFRDIGPKRGIWWIGVKTSL
jgi:hypothetical protein